MGSLSDYTVMRELGQDGLTRRAIARGPDGSALQLRVLEASPAVIGDAAARRASELFEASAELQARAASITDRVCPVLDRGVDERGQRYVVAGEGGTTWGDLAAGRVRLDGATVRHLSCGLLEAASAFRESVGRGHGRVTASTVAVTSAASLGAGRVLLDDPDAAASPEEHEDVFACGSLIYAIVEHRPFEARLWPPQPGAAWSVFGSASADWLKLVTDLCHRNPADRPTLASALERAGGLRAPKRSRPVVPVAIVSLVLLAGAAGAVWWTATREAPAVVDEFGMTSEAAERWRRLCLGWDGWFGAMVSESTRLEAVADDHLRSALLGPLARAREAGVVLDPGAIVGQRGSARLLAERPPEAASEPGAIERTARAVEVLDAIQDATSAERWALAARAMEAGDALTQLGWREAGARLRDRVAAAGGSSEADRASAVLEIADSSALIEAAARAPSKMVAAADAARRTGDPVLTELADTMGSVGEALASLSQALQEAQAWGELAQRLERMIETRWTEVDAEALRAHASLHAPGGRDGLTAAQVGERWLIAVQEERFTRLDQPHPAAAIEVVLDEARVAAAQVDGALAQRLVEAISEASARARALRGRAWNRITRPEIEAEASALRAEAARLAASVEDARWAGEIELEAYAVEVLKRPSPLAAPSDTLDALWSSERERLVAEARSSGNALALRDGIRRLAEVLGVLEASFPVPPSAGLPAAADAGQYAIEAGERRERAIAESVSTAGLRGSDAGAADVERLVRTRVRAYEAELGEVAALLARVGSLERSLTRLEAPPDAEAIGSLRRLAEGQGLAGTVAPVLERAERVLAARTAEDVGLLETIAGSDSPAAAFAAYQRLGELGWPRDAGALQRDAGLRPRLRASAESVDEERARVEAIGVLEAAGAERWRRFAELASDEASVRAAGALREAMSGRAASLSTRARTNLASVALLDAARAGADEDAIRGALRVFVEAMTPGGEDGEAGRRLRGARALLMQDARGPGENPARFGPGAAPVRWVGQSEPGNATVRFDVPGEDALSVTFAAVRVGDRVVYLSTEEVSLGLFSAGMAWADGWESLASGSVWRALGEERDAPVPRPWVGARVWRWGGDRLVANRTWIAERPAFGSTPLIAPSLTEAERTRASAAGRAFRAEGGGGAPSLSHPMQAIPAPAAEQFAQMIGCRLPTPAEWRAAASMQSTSEPGDRATANLRDATWGVQWAHVIALPGEISSHLRPDRGVYAPGEPSDVLDADDGVLYFEPVERSVQSPFAHLVGNVGEFVRSGDGVIGVIGNSALSAPGDPGVPTTLTGARANAAFTDVGFRLAFDAPGVVVRRPLRVEVLGLLGDRVVEPPSSSSGR